MHVEQYGHSEAKTFRTILDEKLSLLPKLPEIYKTLGSLLMKKNYETLGSWRNKEERNKNSISKGVRNAAQILPNNCHVSSSSILIISGINKLSVHDKD